MHKRVLTKFGWLAYKSPWRSFQSFSWREMPWLSCANFHPIDLSKLCCWTPCFTSVWFLAWSSCNPLENHFLEFSVLTRDPSAAQDFDGLLQTLALFVVQPSGYLADCRTNGDRWHGSRLNARRKLRFSNGYLHPGFRTHPSRFLCFS